MLTERECKAVTAGEKPVKIFDGGGLHLLVKPSGYKSWRLKYRFGGKEKQLTFGPYPTLSLREARLMREDAKRDLLQGRDPGRRSREIRARLTGGAEAGPTFRSAALRWHKLQAPGWKERHAENVLASIEAEVFPQLGDLPLKDIGPADIRPIVEAMQDRGAVDQAHRMLGRIARVFDLAIVDELAETNPASAISAVLRPIVKRKYPAVLDLDQVRAALVAFEQERHQPTVLLASRLLALTAARPGPLRFAQPEEFVDLKGENPRWIIPAAKMKLERAESEQSTFDFPIPLSTQAIATVKQAIEFAAGRPYLFPQTRNGLKPISENALNSAYRKSPGFYGRHVPHGWRSSFSTIMNERASELDRPGDRAVIDLMLGHKPEGTEAHYNRAAYMKRRRFLAQEWADLLGEGLAPPEELLDGLRN